MQIAHAGQLLFLYLTPRLEGKIGNFKQDMEVWFGTSSDEPLDDATLWRRTAVQFLLNPGVMTVGMYRMARWLHVRKLVVPAQIIDRLGELLTGAHIPASAEIGPGLRVNHPPGLVVSPQVKLGRGVRLHSSVVLADRGGQPLTAAPVVGDDVIIATGVKILGDITIGNRVMIAANSVVTSDLPDDCIAAGNPAKVVKSTAPPAD